MSDYTTLMSSLSPRAWWRLGDASGNPQDSSGNARHMTANSGLTYGVSGALASSESNNAISAAGAGYATMATDSNLDFNYNVDFSVVFWCKINAQNGQVILAKRASTTTAYPYGFFTTASGTQVMCYRRDGTNQPAPTTDVTNPLNNAWHFVGFRKSGSELRFIVDGILQTAVTDTTTTTTTNSVGVSMFRYNDASSNLTGALDEIAIFGSALTWEQFRGLYETGRFGFRPQVRHGHMPVHNVSMLNMPRIMQ